MGLAGSRALRSPAGSPAGGREAPRATHTLTASVDMVQLFHGAQGEQLVTGLGSDGEGPVKTRMARE